MDGPDHYRALGLSAGCTAQEVLAAYKTKVASRFHPDNGGDPYGWARYQSAFDTLIDANRRQEYDAQFLVDADGSEDSDDSGEEDEDDPWSTELEQFDLHKALGVDATGTDKEHIVGGESRVHSRFYDVATVTWPNVYRLSCEMAEAVADSADLDASGSDAEGDDDDDGDDDRADSATGDEASPATSSAATASAALHEEAEQAITRFRQACLAYTVLSDPVRRRVYATCRFSGLRASESFQSDSVFERDAREVREAFFRGDDPVVREFLLLRADDRDAEPDKHHGSGAAEPQSTELEAEEEEEDKEQEEAEEEEEEEEQGEDDDEEEEMEEEELPDSPVEDLQGQVPTAPLPLDFVEAAQLAAKLAARNEQPPPPPPLGLLSSGDSLAQLLKTFHQGLEDEGAQARDDDHEDEGKEEEGSMNAMAAGQSHRMASVIAKAAARDKLRVVSTARDRTQGPNQRRPGMPLRSGRRRFEDPRGSFWWRRWCSRRYASVKAVRRRHSK